MRVGEVEANSAGVGGRMEVVSVRKRGKNENGRLERVSFGGLRDGMRYLRVEERIADMMRSSEQKRTERRRRGWVGG